MEALARSFARGSLEADTARRTLEGQLEQLRLAREIGVVIALGTDAGAAGVRHGEAFLEEMRLLRAAGLPWEEVIRCATQTGAHMMGLEQEIGSLVPGRPATFVAARGGPEGLPDSLGFPEDIYVRGARLDRQWGDDA
jgi:imidazolonepropionase-like amidohydrolase